MNMTKRSDSPLRTLTCLRWFAQAVRLASIRAATAIAATLGAIVVTALLCVVSARADGISAGGHGVIQGLITLSAEPAAIARQSLIVLLFILVTLTSITLGGWCRTHTLLKRVVETAHAVESERQHRYAAVEAQERAARAAVESQVALAVNREHDRLLAAMRHYVGGPLAALASLLDAPRGERLSPLQQPLSGTIQSAVCTWARTLEDVLASTPVQLRSIALDETPTDIRELVDGVVALFSQIAEQKGVRLSASIHRSAEVRVLADGARLGQIIFHLLGRAVRTTECGQITVAARAETLNAGSQRILVSVTAANLDTPASSTCSMQIPPPSLFHALESEGASRDEYASAMTLCHQLTQYMRGELWVSGEAGPGTCSMFSAPFTIEHPQALDAEDRVSRQTAPQTIISKPLGGFPVPLIEPFDRSYLDALSNEGVDLPAFIRHWRESVSGDLQQVHGLLARHDMHGMRTLLHRLGGAIGLVGAHSLMEALRRASTTEPESARYTVDELEKRIAALMTQLDQAIEPHRSNSQ